MKLIDLFERAEHQERTPLSQKEFDDLPAPSVGNIEDRFKVEKVAFDNRNGAGAVPNNQEVLYFGFAVMMKPSHFLKLATPEDREEDAVKIAKLMEQRVAFGSPFLDIRFDDEAFEKDKTFDVAVSGHEGRARMTAIMKIQGDTPIPVHIIPRGGLRARNFSEKFFEELRKRGMTQQGRSTKFIPELSKIFWMGKTL